MGSIGSLLEIQGIAHQLIKMLSGLDTQALVGEKAEDFKQLKEACIAMADFCAHGEEALGDGIFDRPEFDTAKAKMAVVKEQWAEALAEIKDQKIGPPGSE